MTQTPINHDEVHYSDITKLRADLEKKIRRAERQSLALKHALVAVCRLLWACRPIDRKRIEQIVSSLETVKPSDS